MEKTTHYSEQLSSQATPVHPIILRSAPLSPAGRKGRHHAKNVSHTVSTNESIHEEHHSYYHRTEKTTRRYTSSKRIDVGPTVADAEPRYDAHTCCNVLQRTVTMVEIHVCPHVCDPLLQTMNGGLTPAAAVKSFLCSSSSIYSFRSPVLPIFERTPPTKNFRVKVFRNGDGSGFVWCMSCSMDIVNDTCSDHALNNRLLTFFSSSLPRHTSFK
jgi:hypothetical protein